MASSESEAPPPLSKMMLQAQMEAEPDAAGDFLNISAMSAGDPSARQLKECTDVEELLLGEMKLTF